jgi:hypothetical protein
MLVSMIRQGAATRTTSSSTSPMRNLAPGSRGTGPSIVTFRRVDAVGTGAPRLAAASARSAADCTVTCRCRVPWNRSPTIPAPASTTTSSRASMGACRAGATYNAVTTGPSTPAILPDSLQPCPRSRTS